MSETPASPPPSEDRPGGPAYDPFGRAPEAPGTPVAPPTAAAPPRRMRITGLHHVTLICSDLERSTGFYRDVLGLALVREAVSDDDPGARHFWFAADAAGTPGTLLSLLEYQQMPAGAQGTGAVHHVALGVGSGEEVGAWRDYLRARGIPTTEVFTRSGLTSVYVRDPDGLILEITAPAT